jgi:hypothetical protein
MDWIVGFLNNTWPKSDQWAMRNTDHKPAPSATCAADAA